MMDVAILLFAFLVGLMWGSAVCICVAAVMMHHRSGVEDDSEVSHG